MSFQVRTIQKVITSPSVMMGPIMLKQPLPIQGYSQFDPFLLLHHLGPRVIKPGTNGGMDIGAHPHRGFEPISFVFSGEIHHKDSKDNDSIIGAGGVQWMTAGSGIVHSEGLSQNFIQQGGDYEMIQLWVNLPKDLKMTKPSYQGFDRAAIPFYKEENARVNVISGTYEGITGPINSLTNIGAYTLELSKDGAASFEITKERNVLIYQLKGKTKINGSEVGKHQMVLFDNDGTSIQISAEEKSTLLFLHGDPIDEPVASWGPYVMNTQTEIMEAMRDYQMGKMGVLV